MAIEPDESNFEMLDKNLGSRSPVKLLYGGLWPKKCRLRFVKTDCPNYSYQVTEADKADEGTHRSFVAYTLPEIMEEMKWDGIDLLKLDIEGSELEIFSKNCEDWIYRTRLIVVELHEHYAPGCGKALFSALNGLEYGVSLSGENLVVEIYDGNDKRGVR